MGHRWSTPFLVNLTSFPVCTKGVPFTPCNGAMVQWCNCAIVQLCKNGKEKFLIHLHPSSSSVSFYSLTLWDIHTQTHKVSCSTNNQDTHGFPVTGEWYKDRRVSERREELKWRTSFFSPSSIRTESEDLRKREGKERTKRERVSPQTVSLSLQRETIGLPAQSSWTQTNNDRVRGE